MEDNLSNSMDQTQGVTPNGDSVSNSPLSDLIDVVESNFNNGVEPLDILLSLLQQGFSQETLSIAFEKIGIGPGAFTQLMQDAEIAAGQIQDAQMQQQMGQPQQVEPIEEESKYSIEDIASEVSQVVGGDEQNLDVMQYGGYATNGRMRPLAPPRGIIPYPKTNFGALANLASVAADGFSEMADLKKNKSQIQKDWRDTNKKINAEGFDYIVDYKGLDPKDYAATAENLYNASTGSTMFPYMLPFVDRNRERDNARSFTIKHKNNTVTPLPTIKEAKEKAAKDFMDNSTVTFDSKTNRYNVVYSDNDQFRNSLTEEQRLRNPVLSDFLKRAEALSEDDKDILRYRANYPEGMGLRSDGTSGPMKNKSDYLMDQNIALLNTGMRSDFSWNPVFNSPTDASFSSVPLNGKRSILEVDNPPPTKPSFKEWYIQNAVNLQGKSEMEAMDMYNNTEFKYGGSNTLPSYQTRGETPLSGGGSGMGSAYFEDLAMQDLQAELGMPCDCGDGSFSTDCCDDVAGDANAETTQENPEVTRLDSTGNFISRNLNKAENFLKNNYTMKRIGQAAENTVNLAAVANQYGRDKKAKEAYREQRMFGTLADNVYLPTENPVNKRGTFDVNLGLAEPDNLVDYYMQGKYGREMYKTGGEFEPHMMYDPKSGKAYKANKPEDHERMAKMGYTHDLPEAQFGIPFIGGPSLNLGMDRLFRSAGKAIDSGLRSAGNTINAAFDGDPNYWDDRSRTFTGETSRIASDAWDAVTDATSDAADAITEEVIDYTSGNQGYIPDALTFGIPTRRFYNGVNAMYNPWNWTWDDDDLLPKPLPSYDTESDFDAAFATARKDLGPGKHFMFNGTRHTTDHYGEAPPGSSTEKILLTLENGYGEGDPGLSKEEYDRFIALWNEMGQPPIHLNEKDKNDWIIMPNVGTWEEMSSESNKTRDHVNVWSGDKAMWLYGNYKTSKSLAKAILNELTHNQQVNELGKLGFGLSFLADEIRNSKIGNAVTTPPIYFGHGWPQLNMNSTRTYDDPNALEYQAHSVLKPEYIERVFPTYETDELAYGAELPKAMFGMPKVGLPGMNIMSWAPTGAGGNMNKSIQRVKEDPVSFAQFVNGDMSQAGKFIRFSEQGGELEVDNDTLAALIAAGADIEML